jgi:hypothetical protein
LNFKMEKEFPLCDRVPDKFSCIPYKLILGLLFH